MSQEFSGTENRIIDALSRLEDFLLNPLIQGHSGTAPETSRNVYGTKQGTNEDDSQSDLYPEASILQSKTTQNFDSEDGHDSQNINLRDGGVCFGKIVKQLKIQYRQTALRVYKIFQQSSRFFSGNGQESQKTDQNYQKIWLKTFQRSLKSTCNFSVLDWNHSLNQKVCHGRQSKGPWKNAELSTELEEWKIMEKKCRSFETMGANISWDFFHGWDKFSPY